MPSKLVVMGLPPDDCARVTKHVDVLMKDWVSATTRSERRLLLFVSIVSIAVVIGHLSPASKFVFGGLDFPQDSLPILMTILGLSNAFLAFVFITYEDRFARQKDILRLNADRCTTGSVVDDDVELARTVVATVDDFALANIETRREVLSKESPQRRGPLVSLDSGVLKRRSAIGAEQNFAPCIGQHRSKDGAR